MATKLQLGVLFELLSQEVVFRYQIRRGKTRIVWLNFHQQDVVPACGGANVPNLPRFGERPQLSGM